MTNFTQDYSIYIGSLVCYNYCEDATGILLRAKRKNEER